MLGCEGEEKRSALLLVSKAFLASPRSLVDTMPWLVVRYDSTFCANHSFNFSNALPRWLILFFSLLSISAYVWPSYSKHESQPTSYQHHHHVHFRRTLTYQTQYSPDSPPASHPSSPGTAQVRAPDPRSTQTYIQLVRICLRSLRGASAFWRRRGRA